jgi:hypothetical protein
MTVEIALTIGSPHEIATCHENEMCHAKEMFLESVICYGKEKYLGNEIYHESVSHNTLKTTTDRRTETTKETDQETEMWWTETDQRKEIVIDHESRKMIVVPSVTIIVVLVRM